MRRPKSIVRTILEPLAIAIGLAVLVRAAVHIYAIPSASMTPTLHIGDHIVVTPYLFASNPERGHVIVFRSPHRANEVIVKRVIGTPGDLVDTHLGQVRIGGHAIAEPYLLRAASTGAVNPQIIPANCYFVLGDNRDISQDSRSWGVVPRELVVGRARMILWSSPLDGASDPARASASPHGLARARIERPQRLFKWVE